MIRQAQEMADTMRQTIFLSSQEMRNNIYQVRQILGLPYVNFGGYHPKELLSEWKHLTKMVSDWKVALK